MPAAVASPPAASAGRAGGSVRGEVLLLAAVVVVQLLPLLLLPYLPTQDGPSHQALDFALRVWERPEGAPLRHYLVRNPEALPNWFVFFLQAKVLAFLPQLVAEKVLVAGYVVLLPLALRYALRGVDRDAGFLAALGPVLTYNYLLAMGFLNFCWSLAAFLFALGFYLRRRVRFGVGDAVLLALQALWVYSCHAVTLVMLLLAVATLGGCWALGDARAEGGGWRPLLLALRRRLLLPALAFAPALLLLAAFVGRRLDRPTSHLTFAVKTRQLLALYSLVSLDRRTLVFAAGLSLLLAILVVVLLRQRRGGGLATWDALLPVGALFTIVYYLAPSELAGGGFVNHRLALFPPLALLLWLAAGHWGSRARQALPLAGAALALGLLAMLWLRWREIDRYLAEYIDAAERVEDGRTVLPLGFAPGGVTPDGRVLAFRVWPFVHAVGYVAGRRPIVDLGLYEASEDYFPLRFRPELDPYRYLATRKGGLEDVPPQVDIPAYERRGGRVDYVLLWQPKAAPPLDPATRSLYGQLQAGFERVFVSAGGRAELWRHRVSPLP
ncbi:MAG TPA: hypothetical protein VGV61_05750, partial [Thermoanaerobaculia bacterium]|nr:hypothetical protein [Thermoanaerobaculia bacterium]